MTTKRKASCTWDSRHLGNCFIHRASAGWVVCLLHSDGVTGPSDFFVPNGALDRRHRHSLAWRLKRILEGIITELGDVRRLTAREVAGLAPAPNLGPLWRGRTRYYPPAPGNWNERGKLCPMRQQSGLSYCALRTHQGWLVRLRSIWGNPCGSYLIPFDKVPFCGKKWENDFLLRPLRHFLSHLPGARRIDVCDVERLLGWDAEPESVRSAA